MVKTLKRVVLAVALVAAAYAGFRWGPAVFPRLEALVGLGSDAPDWVPLEAEPAPTPELAAAALDRFEAFRAAEAGERLPLGSTELTAVVRHALPGLLPPGVAEPQVRLRDGKVNVSARVAVAAFPRLPRMDQVVGLLPDTLLVEMRGSLVPLDQNNLALVVDRVLAGRIPVPDRMVGDVLDGLRGNRGTAGLPADALPVPLPEGLESVFVQRDSLVLISDGSGGR